MKFKDFRETNETDEKVNIVYTNPEDGLNMIACDCWLSELTHLDNYILINWWIDEKGELHLTLMKDKSMLERLKDLKEDDGFTLKHYEEVTYKDGYQVGIEGVECNSPEQALDAIHIYHGNCGIWYSKGIYYVDRSIRITNEKDAIELGKCHNQQSILNWKNMTLIWLI